MQNTVLNFYPNAAGNGKGSGFASVLLQDFRTILTKEFVVMTDSFTQLKATKLSFIGSTRSLGNLVKMVANEE
jgi:hypothetical protein